MFGPLKAIFNQIPPISHEQNWHKKPDAQATPKVGPVDNVGSDVLASGADDITVSTEECAADCFTDGTTSSAGEVGRGVRCMERLCALLREDILLGLSSTHYRFIIS